MFSVTCLAGSTPKDDVCFERCTKKKTGWTESLHVQMHNLSGVSLLISPRTLERRRDKIPSTPRSNKDRHGCDSGLLLLINSASYKMSTTSHTDRIQRGSLLLHALRTSISRFNLLCHSGLGFNHLTLTTQHFGDLVCIALKYRSNKKPFVCIFFCFRV